ncbi:hypothetical protein GQ43DRAFT_468978 [Delitschia confertaspora ATCC 74209]|uniref:Uncharacterized protein n=1 Tax=Delitschia confertaspora ATCC 74209 TaxID=1513339 RepID=A0A9P4N2A3_9PLEO|nr:hypothetical protein GQ43DRAFT_468978 [Delitschia confertaspora ATCC 74209]
MKLKPNAFRKNSWVMLAPNGGYTPLPGEQTVYTSPQRTYLQVKTPHGYPGNQPYDLQMGPGRAYLTNRRVIFLPASPTLDHQSFHAPILNCDNSRVAAPWFGANKWECELQPVPNGGLPPQHHRLELSLTFKDGGAYDFFTYFGKLKERLQQVLSVAREDGQHVGQSGGSDALADLNLNNVHLEDLPAYEESPHIGITGISSPQIPQDSGVASSPPMASPQISPVQENFQPPMEPPPDYEEVQRDSVAGELERRLRETASQDER